MRTHSLIRSFIHSRSTYSVPGPEGTMVTKIPKIHALLGLESKGAVGKRTNKCLGEQVREKIKHESGGS